MSDREKGLVRYEDHVFEWSAAVEYILSSNPNISLDFSKVLW